MNIYELLDQVKQRKAMYLGNDYDFQSLSAFVTGYQFAANENHMKTKEYNDFTYFNCWILGHLGIGMSSSGWYRHIKERNPNNDENAFNEFFELLDVFKVDRLRMSMIRVKPLNEESKQIVLKKLMFENSKTIWIESVTPEILEYNSWFCDEEQFQREMKKSFVLIES